MANNFADDVAIEDAHGTKGECNMGERRIWVIEGWKLVKSPQFEVER